MRKLLDYLLIIVIGAGLVVSSSLRLVPYDLTETLGFVTGAACVYLIVREDVLNFPVGIANDIFFFVLFFRTRLFGDSGLQLIYVGLGIQGWYLWLYGGRDRTTLHITRARRSTLFKLSLITLIATGGLACVLWLVWGSLPLLDAFTTILSLVAQYMLNKKYFENWFLWIAADLIYVYIYLSRNLSLTAFLYLVFLLLCVAGVVRWWRTLNASEPDAAPQSQ
ncbi:MAG TPA: nicotinamide riboside transporter PnuC [Pyrinomonadaceae bacterium]|nr:nicotinamide riboside transporter PnuC [Pyrinomonadaceae bacterium]